jgi:hypoxanthine phosphoribosyltransferase
VSWQSPADQAKPVFNVYRGTAPPRFQNEVELECAKLLDFYGVPWEYEPRTFVLSRDAEGRVTSAFAPDFYLPEQDLYVEVTVMRQSLVTRKNRKLREIRELYPDVKIKLFYRRDIERLAQRYRLRLAS